MALDPLIQKAIFEACDKHGQTDAKDVIAQLVDKFSDARLDGSSLGNHLAKVYEHLNPSPERDDA
jgi:hypothetical protein